MTDRHRDFSPSLCLSIWRRENKTRPRRGRGDVCRAIRVIARSTRFDRFSASSSISSIICLSLSLSLSPDSPRCNVRGRSSHEWNSSSSGKKGPLFSLSLSLSSLARSTTAVLRSKTWQIVYTRANDHRRRFALRFASSFPFLLLLDLPPSKFRPFIRGGSLPSESRSVIRKGGGHVDRRRRRRRR